VTGLLSSIGSLDGVRRLRLARALGGIVTAEDATNVA
jgi:hypothetical protein